MRASDVIMQYNQGQPNMNTLHVHISPHIITLRIILTITGFLTNFDNPWQHLHKLNTKEQVSFTANMSKYSLFLFYTLFTHLHCTDTLQSVPHGYHYINTLSNLRRGRLQKSLQYRQDADQKHTFFAVKLLFTAVQLICERPLCKKYRT